MQLTTLNKVVSLFLTGGLVILGLSAMAWRHFALRELLTTSLTLPKSLEAPLAVIGGLLLISLAAAGGAACESLTDLTVRRLIKRAGDSEKWSSRLWQSKAFGYHEFWQEQFCQAVMRHEGFRKFPIDTNARGFAVGILYGSKQSEAIIWAETHYSTYVMVSNLTLLSASLFLYVTGLLLSGWCTWRSGISWIAISVGLALVFSSLALDRYLYSYQVAFRQSVVMLTETHKAGLGPVEETRNPASVADGRGRR